jgi:DNA adenine methylase
VSAASIRVPLSNSARPPIKIAGGKSKLVPRLLEFVPKTFDHRSGYYEPFFGGGALYFALRPRKAFLGDGNPHLISVYIAIRDDVEGLIRELKKPRYVNTEEAYYRVRETAFGSGDRKRVAAEFIFMNKCGFNGLFRVNGDGKFNVPFGKYDNPTICDADNLRACAAALCNTHIYRQDFAQTTSNAQKGDFVYFDPPYWPTSKTANFRGYTSSGFGPDDQVRLRDVALRLKKKGVSVVLSNADVPPVRELYKKGFKIERVEMARSINSDGGKRGKVGELLIY